MMLRLAKGTRVASPPPPVGHMLVLHLSVDLPVIPGLSQQQCVGWLLGPLSHSGEEPLFKLMGALLIHILGDAVALLPVEDGLALPCGDWVASLPGGDLIALLPDLPKLGHILGHVLGGLDVSPHDDPVHRHGEEERLEDGEML